MTPLHHRIATAIAADPAPVGPRWRYYSEVAAAVGCSAQSVYLEHRRSGFRPVVAEPVTCRECGGENVGGWAGFCGKCCRDFGRSWMGGGR